MLGGGFRMLVMRSVAGQREGKELQRRQLLIQRVPVLDREDDVVVAADMQDRNRKGLLTVLKSSRLGRCV